MKNLFASLAKKITSKSSFDIHIIESQKQYDEISDFIINNLHKVTTNLHFGMSKDMVKPFHEWLAIDPELAKDFLWKGLEQEKSTLYIFTKKQEIVAFAVMEPTKFLKYLYVDDSKQKEKIGSGILQFFHEQHDFRVKIEGSEYDAGLGSFYEKNGFRLISDSFSLGKKYYEYTNAQIT